MSRRTEQNAPAAVRRHYCARCEKGWLEGPGGWRPCDCNETGRAVVAEYRREVREHMSAADRGDALRAARAGRSALDVFGEVPGPSDADLTALREEIGHTLASIPTAERSMRREKDAYSAVRDLASILHGPYLRRWGMAQWEAFNLAHPDCRSELAEVLSDMAEVTGT